jgi:hypothetical protein
MPLNEARDIAYSVLENFGYTRANRNSVVNGAEILKINIRRFLCFENLNLHPLRRKGVEILTVIRTPASRRGFEPIRCQSKEKGEYDIPFWQIIYADTDYVLQIETAYFVKA